jgi:hypothetical protein
MKIWTEKRREKRIEKNLSRAPIAGSLKALLQSQK